MPSANQTKDQGAIQADIIGAILRRVFAPPLLVDQVPGKPIQHVLTIEQNDTLDTSVEGNGTNNNNNNNNNNS